MKKPITLSFIVALTITSIVLCFTLPEKEIGIVVLVMWLVGLIPLLGLIVAED